ncbi:hypothetical protein DMC30DRAFT_151937 [Rhodotorula diobovata]|uniref:PQ loop repeat-domain-containing protein n=1 Tax=Rhodotorula diobovata TaxID=5288 RepID=A0A5C5FZN5_9BASI|nr:hypothetical protein DMC30DRAFT_151937 [Rhodotorula diobovata]
MWTTGELASSLLGFCAMGTGIWLFCPEIYDLFKYPPREMDRARLIFFASWLVGDFLHLFGTVFSGHAQTTQIALYIIVASIESFVLVYILFHLGHIPFFKPKRYPVEDVLEKQRDWRYPLQHSIVHAMGVGPDLKMPPRDKRLEEHRRARDQPAIDAANASRRARGLKDHAPKKEIPDTQMALIQIAGTLFVLFVFTAIWYAVTYINRDTKEAPEPMKMSLVAFLPGWAGFFFWVGPRFVSMWQSYSSKKKEGITNGAIFVGGLTHSLNIASIVLINFQGEGLLAQSPYIATSACCVVLDIFRLLCLCAAPLP